MVKRLILALVPGCILLALVVSGTLANACDDDWGDRFDKKAIRPRKIHRHRGLKEREDMRRRDRERYRRMVLMALQGDFDAKLRLSEWQSKRLQWLSGRYYDECYRLMEQYLCDRRMDIVELNHRLTALNRHVASCARHKLTPFQDAVYPGCPWYDYTSECWNEGYHPRAEYVLECLEEDEEPYIWFPQ